MKIKIENLKKQLDAKLKIENTDTEEEKKRKKVLKDFILQIAEDINNAPESVGESIRLIGIKMLEEGAKSKTISEDYFTILSLLGWKKSNHRLHK